MPRPIVHYVGNFRPEHSTENHVADALRSLGVEVVPHQEDDLKSWDRLDAIESMALDEPEFALWTHTHSLAPGAGFNFTKHLREFGVPSIGFHLDRWIGLERESALDVEPYFTTDLTVTADGGSPDVWREKSISHVWMPPAVAEAETERVGVYRQEFDYDVVFVGSWQTYHPEWPHRRVLIERLLTRYPGRFRPFCCDIRGQDLADLYATARVVVGDSCLAGGPDRYWSDRIPETLGRGGFLIHPNVAGLEDWYRTGEHLVTFDIGNWGDLFGKIDGYLADEIGRKRIAAAGRALVRGRDLYRNRMADVRRLAAARSDLSDWTGPVTVSNQAVVARFDVRRPGDGIVLEETWRQNQYGFTPADVRGRTVVDVGANIGDFSIWCALAGAEKVWSYEPDPANLVEFRKNLVLNPRAAERIELVPEAVWSATGDLWTNDAAQGSVQTTDDAPATLVGAETAVVGRHVDEVFARAGSRLIVKIDCEGCEYGVIGAVSDGQLRRADWVIIETHSGVDFGGDRSADWGSLVTTLAQEGTISTMGAPERGTMVTWHRFGAGV